MGEVHLLTSHDLALQVADWYFEERVCDVKSVVMLTHVSRRISRQTCFPGLSLTLGPWRQVLPGHLG
jgi:hypothetical protein